MKRTLLLLFVPLMLAVHLLTQGALRAWLELAAFLLLLALLLMQQSAGQDPGQ